MSEKSELAKRVAFQTEVQNFLTKFCIPDRRAITASAHKNMMLTHFYYVDDFNQGWYVLDDSNKFHKEPNGDEWYVYGTLWADAVKYD